MWNQLAGSWPIIRDLNETVSSDEKTGGRHYTSSSRSHLEDFIKQYELVDGYTWDAYSWKSNSLKGAIIKQRFDWALTSNEWRRLYPRANIKQLTVLNSDHKPILL